MKTHISLDRLRPLNKRCDISILTSNVECVFQLSGVLQATDLLATTAPMVRSHAVLDRCRIVAQGDAMD